MLTICLVSSDMNSAAKEHAEECEQAERIVKSKL